MLSTNYFSARGGERAEKYKICLGVTSGINMNEAIDLVICLGVLCPINMNEAIDLIICLGVLWSKH